jgi:hypothetical protein
MTTHLDTDRMLDAWLAEGFDVANDHVLDVVEDRISHQRQLPGWRVSWRDPHVNAYFKVAAGLAAAVLLAIAGWSVLPKPPTIGEPSPSPLGSVSPSASPSNPSPTRTPRPVPTFASSKFDVPFHVSLGGGWNPPGEDQASVVFNHGQLNVWLVSIAQAHVRPPGTNAVAYDDMEPWPDDLHAWLETLQDCAPEQPRATVVAGRDALVADFRCTFPPGETSVEARIAAASIISFPGGGPAFTYGPAGFMNRIIEIRTGGSAGIAVVLAQPTGTFDADAAAVDRFLATLVFD